jgi:hypothetical protein
MRALKVRHRSLARGEVDGSDHRSVLGLGFDDGEVG